MCGAGAIRPRLFLWNKRASRDKVPITVIKRLDMLEVATADLADAASIYQKNFGFEVTKSPDGKSASVKVGGAQIRLVGGAIEQSNEGMIGLWLEADDVDQVVAAFHLAGLDPGTITVESHRRVLAIDPKIANHVPLFIFDRKA
jgi:hypothetical protein